ncbi:hypothetical protein [Dactylosporangium sp. NPDC051484]|uniref:hypothetical protein n=1 Tax=Dactylosporangium sp. NPDC051484 TaxID=3154942 RepID=UPI00344F7EC8
MRSRPEPSCFDLAADEPVLALTIAVHTALGDLVLAVDVVLPGNRHEIEDTYPLS